MGSSPVAVTYGLKKFAMITVKLRSEIQSNLSKPGAKKVIHI